MTEVSQDPDLTALEELDPDTGRVCRIQISHPRDPAAPKSRCGRPAAYAVEVGRSCCGRRGVLYLCAACFTYESKHNLIRHASGCGDSYPFRDDMVSWRRLGV